MIKLFLFSIIIVMVITGCDSATSDNIPSYIPGVYTKEINDEFTIGADTLTLKELDREIGSYTVKRNMMYRQQIDGKVLPLKHEVHKWVAIYDVTSKQLKEQKQGRLFTFVPAKGILMMGTTPYRKVSK
ncbi:MAG: hypothetical protein ABIN94_07875 [Ferruginibacter sp.]